VTLTNYSYKGLVDLPYMYLASPFEFPAENLVLQVVGCWSVA
jgi:hypothetical protein